MIYTVCGLYVDQDEPRGWAAASFLSPDVDSADDAITFARLLLQAEDTADAANPRTDFALGAVHPGQANRLGEIELAEMEVNPDYIQWAQNCLLYERFRVNGISLETWETLHFEVQAYGADLAYLKARQEAQIAGHTLLYTCTHAVNTAWIEGFPRGRFPYTQ